MTSISLDRTSTTPDPVEQRQDAEPAKAGGKRRKLVLGLFAAAVVVLVFTVWNLLGSGLKDRNQELVFYEVRRTALPITVTERGNLESQQEVDIMCEVENLGGDRSGNSGTQILMIVPNGTEVAQGDLLVELDSAPLQDRLDTQLLALEKARAEQIQANVKHANQITQNETALEQAKLSVKLAELELQNYEDEEGGTFQIDLQVIELAIREQQAKQVINENDLRGIEMLYKLGYKTKSDLAGARLSQMQIDGALAKSISERKEMVKYRYPKTKLELQGTLNTAIRSLTQVERDNESLLAQAKAAKDAADRSLAKEEERYERYTEQLEKCKIYAPVAGMVTFAPPSRYSPEIQEGAFVRQRQKIMSLPSLKLMQVKTAVHESVLDQVRPGLPATCRLDAFPDRHYRASVKSVAVLPDSSGWLNSDTKVYSTYVTIDEEVQQLKPGMTAVIDIHVDRLKDVLSVPVQAIVQINNQNWVYVDDNGRVARRLVELGKTNDKFVQITDGVEEADRVVLNPMSIVDDTRDAEREIAPDQDASGEPEGFDYESERQRAKKTQSEKSAASKKSGFKKPGGKRTSNSSSGAPKRRSSGGRPPGGRSSR